MNAISIKNHLKAAACAAALLLAAACSNELPQDDGANPNGNPNEGIPLTLTASVPGGEGANTRISYEDPGAGSNVKLTWTEGDAFRLYTSDLSSSFPAPQHAGKFTWQSGGTGNQFKGVLIADTPGDAGYAAYYPANKFPETTDGTPPEISLTGQVQTGNGNMDHLAAYNFMSATGITDLTQAIQFKSLLTLLTFDLTMPAEVTTLNAPTQLKIAASNASGPKEVFTNTLFGMGADASELSIDLNGIEIGADQKLKVYMLVHPFVLDGEDFSITVSAPSGDYTYKTAGVTKSYAASGRYTATVDANGTWTNMSSLMQFTVRTTEASQEFAIPFTTSGTNPAKIIVDWGDGSTKTVNEGFTLAYAPFTHTYATADTYQITITSDKPANQQQTPLFSFGKVSYSRKCIVSFDTPLLNTGQTDFSNTFKECENLTKVDAGLFANNTSATNFNSCFISCTNLAEIPAGLFAKNTGAKEFTQCFRDCKSLATVPEGLFAKNMEVTTFSSCFNYCTKLTLNENIFIDNPADKETRFKDKNIDFERCFYGVGYYVTVPGTAPDLWNYTMGSGTTTADCFSNCNMSNASIMTADQKKAWGTPKDQ